MLSLLIFWRNILSRIRERHISNFATLSAATLTLVSCGQPGNSDSGDVEINAGSMSIKSERNSEAVSLTIGGKEVALNHLLNCTISPVLSGVVAMERDDMENPGATLRITAITENGQTGAQISFFEDPIEYTYEGAITLDGKTLSWAGDFTKHDTKALPNDLDRVAGSFSVSC